MKDPKYHSKTKHIDIKYNFIRDIVASGEIILQYISTLEMIADPFTKAISKDLFEKHVMALRLRRIWLFLCIVDDLIIIIINIRILNLCSISYACENVLY